VSAEQLNFHEHGAEIVYGAVSHSVLDSLGAAFAEGSAGRPGVRSLAKEASVAELVSAEGAMGAIAQRFAERSDCVMRPVRIIFFDKTADTNWAVPWHQDRTIAVKARHDVPGFRNWNQKGGVDHVEPPVELLSRMLTLRLHLDDTGVDNGALDILPGSHRLGRLRASDVVRLGHSADAVSCVARAGDILAMRLTTIHKSEKSSNPSRRRVFHVDYSPDSLPPPLEWQLAI
jgi:ectoine hydroxylase-related dioxygenase (phytanoyl-CoA dioxygenase family)